MKENSFNKDGLSHIHQNAENEYKEKFQSIHNNLSLSESKDLLRKLQIRLLEIESSHEKEMNEKVRLEEDYQKYFSLFMLAPICFFVLNEKGSIIECNLAAANLIDIEQDKIINRNIKEFICSSDQDIFNVLQQQYFEENIIKTCEIRIRNSREEEVWVKIQPLVAIDILNFPLYGFVLTDIGFQKSIEFQNELEESEKDAIINSTNDLIWSVTKDFKLITCNNSFRDSAKAFSGVIFQPGDEVLLRDHYSEEIINYWEGLYKKALNGEVVRVEYYTPKLETKDETWLELNINPIYWNNEITSIACFGRVITERKQNELKLVHSAKMASLGEMAGGVAHEINNPLSILLGYTGKLSRQLSKPSFELESILSDLEKIKETTKRISSIVNGLSSFSRNSANDPFLETSLEKIITNTLGLCQEKLRINGVEIKIGKIPDILFECRSAQISQVLLNLLNNAFDAISPFAIKWIQVDVQSISDDRFRVIVTDSGNGIPAEIADKMMQPFFTTKEVGKGTGLGLSVSLGITQGHGGTLTLDKSCLNTRFVLELPIKQKV